MAGGAAQRQGRVYDGWGQPSTGPIYRRAAQLKAPVHDVRSPLAAERAASHRPIVAVCLPQTPPVGNL